MGLLDSKLARGYGTLMGFAFIGTTALLGPSTLLLDPRPAGTSYLIGVAALFTGFALIALPWQRINPWFLNLIGVVAVIETAIAVEVFGPPYAAIYFLIAISVAYIAPTPRTVTAQFALIGVGVVAPILWHRDDAREIVQQALLILPLLAITGGLVAYLRLRLVADHRSYRHFAEQTLALATRIAGRPLQIGALPVDDPDLPRWARRAAIGSRVALAGSIFFACPLLGAGLATAGVNLPGPVESAYEKVGMTLPNQDPDGDLRPIDADPPRTDAQAPSPEGDSESSSPQEPDVVSTGDGPGDTTEPAVSEPAEPQGDGGPQGGDPPPENTFEGGQDDGAEPAGLPDDEGGPLSDLLNPDD